MGRLMDKTNYCITDFYFQEVYTSVMFCVELPHMPILIHNKNGMT